MPSRNTARQLAAAAVVVAGLTLTACGGHGSSASASGSTAPSSQQSGSPSVTASNGASVNANTGSTVASGQTGSTSGAGTGSTGTSGTSAGSTGTAACTSAQLKAGTSSFEAGAGSITFDVTLTNTSSKTCVLRGFPGVSFSDSKHDLVGEPADRTTETPAVVTLHPGGHAVAPVRTANGQSGYSAKQCGLYEVPLLQVFPPNQKQALFTAWNRKSCLAPGLHVLQVGPVQAG